jgi:hypothetical protein
MASVQKRHFVVEAGLDPTVDESELQVKLESTHTLEVDLAALLEANAMAERDIDWELRYRVLQHELRIILSYISDEGLDGQLRLDVENFAATAGHIKRFISESVGLGMLTAAVQECFAWEFGPDAISNFDVLPGELKDQFGKGGVRPDLLFDFKDDVRAIAGEARGRSQSGPPGMLTRAEQRQRMKDMLQWSSDHGDYPVTMTWAYLGGHHIQVDLFTMSDQSVGSLEYALQQASASTPRPRCGSGSPPRRPHAASAENATLRNRAAGTRSRAAKAVRPRGERRLGDSRPRAAIGHPSVSRCRAGACPPD